MSFFDEASLVMIPSGYKDQKVYSVKPLDGSGDLTFSRASSATRVASNGLIEKVRTNLILQSEDFTNVAWAVNAAPTITANTTVAPNGTTTADTIASSGSSSGAYQVPTVVSGVEYSFSVYVKNITSATNVQIGCDLGPTNGFLNFNAVTGAITSTAAGITGSSVTNVGNGWYRVSGTYIATGTTNTFIVFGQSGMTFAVWGAQLETGVTTDYIATTSAAVSVGPVSGLPRLDYLNSSCPRLLLEPQRSNLMLYSEQFDNAYWTKTRATISANNATSPDGYTNADKLVENAISGTHFVDRTITGLTASAVHSFSIFAKKAEREFINLQCVTTGNSVFVNLNNGAISIGGGYTSSTVKVESYSNSWYRITVNDTPPSTSLRYIVVTATDSTTSSYTGDGTSGILIYGAQLEAGAYATSYIPTLGTSVTRVADAASKTGISSLIGQTEGTLFAEVEVNPEGASTGIRTRNSATGLYNDTIALEFSSSRQPQVIVLSGGVTQVSIVGTSLSVGFHKIAFAYKNNDFALYADGVQIGTSSSGILPVGMNELYIDQFIDGGIRNAAQKQTLLFKTRLSNSDLAALTA